MHAQLCLTLWTPCTVACQALLFMEFSRQEYWNRFPFLSPGDLPNSGMELGSLASPALAGRFLYHCAAWEAHDCYTEDTKRYSITI